MSEHFAALRKAQLLRDFTDVGVRILAEAAQKRTVGRSTYAFRAGEPSNGLHFIARGTLNLLPRDGSQAIGEVTVGDSLGGLSLLLGGEHLVSAFATTDVELITLARPAFDAMKTQKPGAATKLELALSRDLIERMREAKGPLREFLSWQVSKRAT
ncbi:MAG: Crp/Fnr family transcriptional regulator [Deltaproteobacteria bacterium]|nr:Crp/Fnr family transcriptional regulator [Deltaproteobacteria bacterium]